MSAEDLRIGIIVGSTRPGRKGEAVARWVLGQAASRVSHYEIIDLEEHPLPFYDEARPAVRPRVRARILARLGRRPSTL